MLNRPQYPQLSNAELSQNDGRDKKSADGPCESEKQVTQSCRELITDAHKDSDINKYTQVQPCSSSICVAEYLADHVAVDSVSSGDAANPSHKQSIDVAESSPSDLTDSKKTIKFDDENDMGKYEGTELEPAKNEEEQWKGQQPMNELLTMESDMSVDHNFKGQRCEESCTQVTQNSAFYIYWGKDDCNCTPRPLSEIFYKLLSHMKIVVRMWQQSCINLLGILPCMSLKYNLAHLLFICQLSSVYRYCS